MSSFAFKHPKVAHIGNRVSHAKNRRKHAFKYNLSTVTVVEDGQKKRLKVPTRVVKTLKKKGLVSTRAK